MYQGGCAVFCIFPPKPASFGVPQILAGVHPKWPKLDRLWRNGDVRSYKTTQEQHKNGVRCMSLGFFNVFQQKKQHFPPNSPHDPRGGTGLSTGVSVEEGDFFANESCPDRSTTRLHRPPTKELRQQDGQIFNDLVKGGQTWANDGKDGLNEVDWGGGASEQIISTQIQLCPTLTSFGQL